MGLRSWFLRRSVLAQQGAFQNSRSGRPRKRRTTCKPSMELLEARILLSTYVVTTTADNGENSNPTAGSLRAAIVQANLAATGTAATPDVVDFNIPATDSGYQSATGSYTIQPPTGLPLIFDTMIIDGSSQPGYVGSPIIVLSGSQTVGTVNGICFVGGNSTLNALVVNQFKDSGVALESNGGDTVTGCYIGTDVTGAVAEGNDFCGIYMAGESDSNNVVGGESFNNSETGLLAGAGNLISGNVHSILVDGSNSNVIEGNYIGTDATGTQPLGNHEGPWFLDGSSDNTIGGVSSHDGNGKLTGLGNLIAGNDYWGINLDSTFSDGGADSANTVQGNFIGTDVTGTLALPNGTGDSSLSNGHEGIDIFGGSSFNLIGGTTQGTGNVISGNAMGGIYFSNASSNIIEGNKIGTDVTGTLPLGNQAFGIQIDDSSTDETIGGTSPAQSNVIAYNTGDGVLVNNSTGVSIRGNSIFANGGLGIDLTNSANNSPVVPVLSSVTSTSRGTTITGTLLSTPSTTFAFDFYSNDTRDPSFYGQGQTYLGSASFTTDLNGYVDFTATLSLTLPSGLEYISATATDSSGNTSQFSLDLPTIRSVYTVTTTENLDSQGNVIPGSLIDAINHANADPYSIINFAIPASDSGHV